jgi:hypothetical protein
MSKSVKHLVLTLTVIAGLLLTSIPSLSVSPPKPGTSCSKSGLTKKYLGKKYTCIKSGKKLIWSNGVGLIATPSPSNSKSAVTTSTPEKSEPKKVEDELARDTRITSEEELSNLAQCKTEDQTKKDGTLNGPWSNSNGFPRPEGGVYGKSAVNVLVYPLEFSNSFPINEEFLNRLKDSESLSKRIYATNSYDKVKLKFHYLPRELWWNSEKPLHEWNYTNRLRDSEKLAALAKIFEKADERINFDLYDTVMMISTAGGWEGEAIFGASIKAPNGTVRNLVPALGVTSSFLRDQFWSYFVAHELGHSLYALEDLYLQYTSQYVPSSLIEGDSDRSPKGINDDLMVSNVENFIGWNRFLNGWLTDSEVRCVVRQKETVHYLSDLQLNRGPRLLLLSLGEGVTVTVEVRVEGIPKLITRLVDTRISHAYIPIRLGPVLTLDSSGNSTGNLAGWKFEVLKTNSEGMLFKVNRVLDFPIITSQTSSSTASKPKSPEDLDGQSCSKENEIVRNSEGEFWCLKLSAGLRWSKNNK